MGHTLTPDVHKCHEERFGKYDEVEDTSKDDTSCEEHYYQPEKISIALSAENLSLDFVYGEICEVDVEDEAEVEFSHEEECCEGAP